MEENVNHPIHYQKGGLECIEVIEAVLGEEKLKGFLLGNIIKYVWRYPDKGGSQDLKKARVYLDKLTEIESKGEPF